MAGPYKTFGDMFAEFERRGWEPTFPVMGIGLLRSIAGGLTAEQFYTAVFAHWAVRMEGVLMIENHLTEYVPYLPERLTRVTRRPHD